MKDLYKFILTLLGIGIAGFIILLFIRFCFPMVRLCSENGRGNSARTQCFGIIEFRGSDIHSAYHIRFLKG